MAWWSEQISHRSGCWVTGGVLAANDERITWWDSSVGQIRWCWSCDHVQPDASIWLRNLAAEWLREQLVHCLLAEHRLKAHKIEPARIVRVVAGTKLPMGMHGVVQRVEPSKYRSEEQRVLIHCDGIGGVFVPSHHVAVASPGDHMPEEGQIRLLAESNCKKFLQPLCDVYAACLCGQAA